MIIACDIDGVLNNLVAKTLEVYNFRNQKNIQISDITSYNFFDCLSPEDAKGIISLFKEKALWDSLKPLQGAQESLKQLIKKGHKVYLATATDPVNFKWKIDWLTQFYTFIPSDNVIRINDKSLLKCDVIIDDCLDNLIGNFAERICLNYPWNQSATKDYAYNIHRCNNWHDIVSVINKLEQE